MNIHEYQAKQLLAQYGVTVPFEIPAKSLAEVRPAAEKIAASGSAKVVVKSQIHAGGRGKGTFQSGFRGGGRQRILCSGCVREPSRGRNEEERRHECGLGCMRD